MVHVAIMKKSWGLVDKIISGEKIIETRWYKNKAKPYKDVKESEVIYFKDSGGPVRAKAIIAKVEKFEDLDNEKIGILMKRFSKFDLGVEKIPKEIEEYIKDKRYALIIYLKDVKEIQPFKINKKGFGLMSAWITVSSINEIKV